MVKWKVKCNLNCWVKVSAEASQGGEVEQYKEIHVSAVVKASTEANAQALNYGNASCSYCRC